MSYNETKIFIVLSFRQNEANLFKIFAQRKLDKKFLTIKYNEEFFYNKFQTTQDLDFSENEFYVTKIYEVSIDNFNSIRDQIKIILVSDKEKEYSTQLIKIKPNEYNFLFNTMFRDISDEKEVFKKPPDSLKLNLLDEYIIYMRYCLIYNDFKTLSMNITENNLEKIFDSIGHDSCIDNVLEFYYLNRNQNKFFGLNSMLEKLNFKNFQKIPLKSKNLDIEIKNLMKNLKEELFDNEKQISKKKHVILFLLNFYLQYNDYKNVADILKFLDKKELSFEVLPHFKKIFSLNKQNFDKLLSCLHESTDKYYIDKLFSLIIDDDNLIECIKSSWLKLEKNLIYSLSNNYKTKLRFINILNNLEKKDLQNCRSILDFLNLKKNPNSDTDVINVRNLDINYIDEYTDICFVNVFNINYEESLEYFLKFADDLDYFFYLSSISRNFNDQIKDQSIFQKISKKIKEFISKKLSLKRDVSVLLKFIEDVLKYFSYDILSECLEMMRNKTNSKQQEEFVINLTDFKNDDLIDENFKLYKNMQFDKFLKENELFLLKKREIQNLSYENYFDLYGIEKIQQILKQKNRQKYLGFLFDKLCSLNRDSILQEDKILIKVLNNFAQISNSDEFKDTNFEEIIFNILDEQSKKYKLDFILSFYVSKIIENLDKTIFNYFITYLSKNVKSLTLENLIDLFYNSTRKDYKNNDNYYEILFILIENSKRFIPALDHFLENIEENKLIFFNSLFEFILKKENQNKSFEQIFIKNKYYQINPIKEKIDYQINLKESINENDSKNLDLLIQIDKKKDQVEKLEDSDISQENLSNSKDIKTERILEYPFRELIKNDNHIFKSFYNILEDLNHNLFNDNLLIEQYLRLERMNNGEKKIRIKLLSLFQDVEENYESKFFNKLEEVSDKYIRMMEIKEFKSFYLKSLREQVLIIENFEKTIINIMTLKSHQVDKLIDSSKQLIDLYNTYHKYDNKSFKTIFEYFYSSHLKDKTANIKGLQDLFNISDPLILIQSNFEECVNQVKLIKEFFFESDEDLTMSELIKIFSPLINSNVKENLICFKISFGINENELDNIIFPVLELYSKTHLYLNNCELIIKFVENYEIKPTEFLKSLIKTYENIKSHEKVKMSNYFKSFQEYQLENIISNNELPILLNLLNENLESFTFIKIREEDDLRNLIEFVDDIGDSYIKPETIKTSLKVLDFYKVLDELIKNSDDEHILNKLTTLISEKKFKDINLYIDDVSKNIHGIKQLYNKIANREEYSKIKIKEMHFKSRFYIYLDKKDENYSRNYICDGTYGPKNRETNLDEVRDLRDRSLLLSKKKINLSIEIMESKEDEFEREENKYLEICRKFSENVNFVFIIYENLKYLYDNGYHKNYKIEIIITDGDMKISFENFNVIPDEALEYFYERYNEIKKSYELFYEKYPFLTYFHGRQIHTLYKAFKHLKNEKKKKNSPLIINEGLYLINYLLDSEINLEELKNILISFDIEYEDNLTLYDLMDKVAKTVNYLNEELNIIKQLKSNPNENKSINRLYSMYLGKEEFENEIINIFYNSNNSLPNYKNVLICDEGTSIMVIMSFLYRAFYSVSESPFVLINSDEMENDKQIEIHKILNKVLKERDDKKNIMKSKLIITYNNHELEYVIKIKKLFGIGNLEAKNHDKIFIQNLFRRHTENVTVVNSDSCGIGKSHYIKKISKKCSNYFYFPVSGEIEKYDLIQRLKKLDINKNSLLHIDLNESNQEIVIRSFLFELLITNCVIHNNYVFRLKRDVKIYIEVPFGFVDFLTKYPILKNFKLLSIEKGKKKDLEIDDKLSDNIQLVANYFLNLKNGNIVKNNIYLGCFCENPLRHAELCQHYNSVPLNNLSKNEIYDLIDEHFSLQENSYYQIETFVNFLAYQFRLFSSNFYFGVKILQDNQQIKNRELLPCRKILVESFVDITKYFTKSAYDNLINAQNSNQRLMLNNKEINENVIIKNLVNENIISFNKIKFVMIFFNADGQGISIIVKKNDPNYQKLFYLYNAFTFGQDVSLIDYESLSNDDFMEQMQIVLAKQGLVYRDHTGVISFYDTKGYVFTSDNFLKMQLILLRLNSKIPVIMMGETGCGKTSLIKILSELQNVKLYVLNIHAGISDKEIIKFIEDKVMCGEIKRQKWVFLDEINTCNSLGLIAEILCKRSYQGKKIPDDISFICACNPYRIFKNCLAKNIGIEKVENRLENKNFNNALAYKVNPLPFPLLNFVFDFGSLSKQDENSYIRSMIEKFFADEKIKFSRQAEFAEFIQILIFSSQNFIREENAEISSVSLRDVRRFIIFFKWFKISLWQRSLEEHSIYFKFREQQNLKDMLIISAMLSVFLIYYLRIPNKKVKAEFICILCNLMKEYNPIYNDPKILLEILYSEQKDIFKRINAPKGIAGNSALLENIFAVFHGVINKVPVYICGKPGCSKSLAIQLIYSSLRGENSKDPYFKTLPRLFMNCYQGSISSKSSGIINVFKKARNLIQNNQDNKKDNFSNKINNVSKSNSNFNNIQQEKIISLVFFDEMGLAEISKNNPLKVLHSELEPDKEEDRVAFIGISNWKLDASKSNRGIFIGRPDLDEDDLIQTANTIAKSYVDQLEGIIEYNRDNYNFILEALAKTYFNYKEKVRKEDPKKNGFHGTRDFYYLIKFISKQIVQSKDILIENEILEIVQKGINRNFSGLENSLRQFKTIFSKYYEQAKNFELDAGTIQSIESNLGDLDSRYLMIIGPISSSMNLVQNIIEKMDDNQQNYKISSENHYKFIIGSQFERDIDCENEGDQFSEEYSYKVLNKIQIYMEQGKILILNGLNSIYPSLYDLFNQNFSVVGGKKYARIALGTSNNPMAYVNNNFKCIIILDENELEMQDPPFLNRFEKTIINLNTILKKNNYTLGNKIYEKIDSFLKLENGEVIELDIKANLINFNKNEIFGLIYYYTEIENIYDEKKLEEKILNKIIRTFSQDIIAIINHNLINKNPEELKIINKIYQANLCNNIQDFIEKKNKKHVINFVYTYSSIFDDLTITDDRIYNEIYSITSFKYEFDLEKVLTNFYKKNNNLLVIKFRSQDMKFLNYVKFLCESIQKNFENIDKNVNNKEIIFIIYLSRILKNEKMLGNEEEKISLQENRDSISFISQGEHVFIDNLNNIDFYENIELNVGKSHIDINSSDINMIILDDHHIANLDKKKDKIINILDIFNLTFENMIQNEKLFNLDKNFSYSIYNSYTKIGFDSENFHDENNKNYIERIINLIKETEILKRSIIAKTRETISIQETWYFTIMQNRRHLSEKLDLIGITKNYLLEEFQISLTKIIYSLEQSDSLEYLIHNNKNEHLFEILLEKTLRNLNKINISKKNISDRVGGNILKKVFGFKVYDSKNLFDNILGKLEKLLVEIADNQESLRSSELNEEDFENLMNYYNELEIKVQSEFNYILRNAPQFDYLDKISINKETITLFENNLKDDFLLYFRLNKLYFQQEENPNDQNSKDLFFSLNPNEIYLSKKSATFKDVNEILNFINNTEFKLETITIENFSKLISFLIVNITNIQRYVDILLIFKKYYPECIKNFADTVLGYKYPNTIDTKYSECINLSHYKISAQIYSFLLEILQNIEDLDDEKTYQLLNDSTLIKDQLFLLDYSLRLYLKDAKKIKNLDEINLFLVQENKGFIAKFYRKYINYLNEEKDLLKYYRIDDLIKNIDLCFDLINETFYYVVEKRKNNEHSMETKYHRFLIEFLIIKFQSIDDDELREHIANRIISDEILLLNSKSFIQNYFYYYYDSKYDLIPFFDEDTKSGNVENFGDFSKKENNFIRQIEEKISKPKEINEYLYHTIILIFEIYIEKFFILFEKCCLKKNYIEEFIKNAPFDYFKKSYKIWENLHSPKRNDEVLYPFLLKIYAISYMRIYLQKYVNINFNHNENYNFEKINKILNEKTRFSIILKLYILKIIKEKYLKTWDKFNNFDFKKNQMNWKNETKELSQNRNDENRFKTLYVDVYNIEKYRKFEDNFTLILSQNENEDYREFSNTINNENFKYLIDFGINNIFSLVILNKNEQLTKNFYNFSSNFFKDLNITNSGIIHKIFEKIINIEEIFDLRNQPDEKYEIYFILFKYYLILLTAPEGTIYDSSAINQDFNSRNIPGNYIKNIHQLNFSYHEIKKINDNVNEIAPSCIGCYMCSCEMHYFVQPCGSPTESQTCIECKLPIGAINNLGHTLVKRDGHYRVYKNQTHRNTILNSYNFSEERNFNFKYTEDLKTIIDERIFNNSPIFNQIPLIEIIQNELSLPNLNILSFRLMNLLQNLYHYLSFYFGFLSKDNYEKCNLDDMTCKDNIEKNISVIEKICEKHDIKNVAIFLNIIYEIYIREVLFKRKKNLTCHEKVENELEMNKILIDLLNNTYNELNLKDYYENHQSIQNNYKQLDPESLEFLLDERNLKILSRNKNLPDFQYFKIKKNFDRELLENKLHNIQNYEIEYPTLHNFITNEYRLGKLININKMNPFINDMISRYSYKITRKEAKLEKNSIQEKLDEIYDANEKKNLMRLFYQFQEGWKEISENALQYGCKKKMVPLKEITLNLPIANVLNDDGEYLYGMYIASGYQNLIEIQNEFLTAVKNAVTNNIRLLHLKSNFNNKIIVQKAKPFQVIEIDDKKFGKFINFLDLVYSNVFLNKTNFSEIYFDFDLIEKELFNILVQSKKLFNDEQSFVVYTYESFRGNNSAIITNFSKRIKQKNIDNNLKMLLSSLLTGNKIEKIISNFTSMIFYLQNTDISPDSTLYAVSEKMFKSIQFDKKLIEFFKNNLGITLDKLVEIFNYCEKLCFDKIKENVSNDYREKLIEENKILLDKFFSENPNKLITKCNLSTAIRRFISRFLTKDDEFDKMHSLIPIIFSKEEFWENEVFNHPEFDADLIFGDIEIKIKESLSLYEFLGGEPEIILMNEFDFNRNNDLSGEGNQQQYTSNDEKKEISRKFQKKRYK